MRVAGSVLLDRVQARGEVLLTSAHVDGELNLSHALCSNPGKGRRSINASSLVVGGELLCLDGFRAEGEVCLQWAQLQALAGDRRQLRQRWGQRDHRRWSQGCHRAVPEPGHDGKGPGFTD